nr:hypothetical protein [Pedobacter kyonggii]
MTGDINEDKSPPSIVIARRLFQPTKQSFYQGSLAGKIASSFLLAMTTSLLDPSMAGEAKDLYRYIPMGLFCG